MQTSWSSRIRGFIRFLIILVVILAALYFTLTNEKVDRKLTSLFGGYEGEENKKSNTVVHVNGYDKKLKDIGMPEVLIYLEDKMLYISREGQSIDITPADIDMSLYSNEADSSSSFLYRKNACVSKNQKYTAFILNVNEIPCLYAYNASDDSVSLIASRVDSFDILDDENGLSVLYAIGYVSNNEMYIYRNGVKESIGLNVSGGYINKYRAVVYYNPDGNLYRYDIDTGERQKIDSKVTGIYYPDKNEYNYDDAYGSFTVYVKKDDGDYIVSQDKDTVKLENSFYDDAPYQVFKTQSDKYYYYNLKSRNIFSVENGVRNVMFQSVGDINKVFCFDSITEQFVVATTRKIYLLKCTQEVTPGYNPAVCIMDLGRTYKKNEGMVRMHMDVYTDDYTNFYISMLTNGSIVLNKNNEGSWLNRLSSFVYGLYYVKVDGNKASECKRMDTPESRKLYGLHLGSEHMYLSYFNDGSVKSVSSISNTGNVIIRDMTGTGFDAKGVNNIEVLFCENVYIVKNDRQGKALYLYQVVNDGSDIREMKNNKEAGFCVYSSFGKIVVLPV